MFLIKCVCVLFVVSLALANEDTSDEEKSLDLSDPNQNWRAVDHFSPLSDSSGWSPQTETEAPKRRRIRKRKRRPPMISLTSSEAMGEPWEMSDESSQKSYVRRRLTPVFEEPVRDPFTGLREAEKKQQPDLKTLLKQTGGELSLSELLQEKNLSLAELLMGNRQALSALVETTTEAVATTERYRRLPPSIALRKDITERNFRREEDELSSDEILEAQRKRLSLLHPGHGDSKMFTDITKFDVVTEETTEKRIFVPVNSKIYGVDVEEIVETTTTTTTTPATTQAQLVSRPKPLLPITSAKLNKLVTTTPVPIERFKAIPIKINEIFGFQQKKNETEDVPFRMSFNLMESIQPTTTTEKKIEDNIITSTRRADFEGKTTPLAEKMKEVTAKDEIMEILKNPVDREQLSRILRNRNMTVEQLVEQRERGSSQLHLADIFHNKTREPEPKDEPMVVGRVNPPDSFFNSFPVFGRRAKSGPVRENPESATRTQEYTITSFPTFKIELNKNTVRQSGFPGSWKELYPGMFDHQSVNSKKEEELVTTPSTTTTTMMTSTSEKIIYEDNDLLRIEDVDNKLSESDKLNIELRPNIYGEEDEDFISLPSGVKSAILASAAIVGLSLMVFVTILLIFKWSQRQKRKLNYHGSFSGSRIKSPILEGVQRRSLKTFMSETLGRKKNNYYKAHMQSMSDSIWDSEKKSYMI